LFCLGCGIELNNLISPQTSSIVKAKWPEAGKVDLAKVKASSYLMDTAHAFRLHLKNYMHQLQKPRKGAAPVQAVDKPTKGTVWVAKSYPPWQSAVLTSLKKLHQVKYAKIAYYFCFQH
jgi:leucyl-tRNA synthetase